MEWGRQKGEATRVGRRDEVDGFRRSGTLRTLTAFPRTDSPSWLNMDLCQLYTSDPWRLLMLTSRRPQHAKHFPPNKAEAMLVLLHRHARR